MGKLRSPKEKVPYSKAHGFVKQRRTEARAHPSSATKPWSCRGLDDEAIFEQKLLLWS